MRRIGVTCLAGITCLGIPSLPSDRQQTLSYLSRSRSTSPRKAVVPPPMPENEYLAATPAMSLPGRRVRALAHLAIL